MLSFLSTNTFKSFSSGLFFQTIFLPVCICAWLCPNWHARPCTYPCWISWDSQRPTSPACQDPCGCSPSLKHVSSTPHLGVIGKLAEGALIPLSMSLTKLLNSARPNTDPRRIHSSLVSIWTTLWVWPCSQFPIHQVIHPSNSCLPNLVKKMSIVSNALQIVQVDDVQILPYTLNLQPNCKMPSNLSDIICPLKSHVGYHQSSSYIPYALAQFPGLLWSFWAQKWDWLAWSSLCLPFFLFKKMMVMFLPFSVSGNFIRLLWHLEYNGQWLSNFLHQLSQAPQMHLIRSCGFVHLQMPQIFSNLTFSYSRQFFILPVSDFALCDLSSVVGALAGEVWDKKVIEYLSLLHVLGWQASHLLPERAHIFYSLHFITNIGNSIVQSVKYFLIIFFLLIPSNVNSAPACFSAVPILICTDISFWRGDGTLAASDVILSSKNALTKPLLLNSSLVKSEDKTYNEGLGLVGMRKDQEDISTLHSVEFHL